jgi:hypothetical protein
MKTKITKNQPLTLKVIDFSIWNGIKFGFGFMIGSAIGSLAFMIAGIILMMMITMLLGIGLPAINV